MKSAAAVISDNIRNNHKLSKFGVKNRSLAFGVGVNDADYSVKPVVDGVMLTCPAYQSWHSMIRRSFSSYVKSSRSTYADVSCCDEWKSFMKFREWWIENHVDGWQLDKDLLLNGNKTYSPDACVFVPPWLNCMTINRAAGRGRLKIGVSFHKASGKYQASCSVGVSHKSTAIGLFDTEDEAHAAWLSHKISYANSRKSEMDKIDTRIYFVVIDKISNNN